MSAPVQLDWLADASFKRVTTHPAAPRARRSDPQSSHDAAAQAARSAADHRSRIEAVIKAAGEQGACAREIERRTGLTVVQINRRVLEIGGIERRLRKDATNDRDFERREGCSIWWTKP